MKNLRNDLLKEETIEYKIKQDGYLRNLTPIELISVVCGWGLNRRRLPASCAPCLEYVTESCQSLRENP